MRAGAVVGFATVLSGCVYLNLVYNARRLYDEAERERWAGRDEEARTLYDSVVVKAARTYRAEPEGEWADDALYLLGRAYLRRGEAAEAIAALERTLEITNDAGIRAGALLYLGVTLASTGDRGSALQRLNEALRVLDADHLRAEGHYWRGKLLLETELANAGWWDLDRAAEADTRYRMDADLERLTWGLMHRDSLRAHEGVARLLALPEARVREDTLLAMVGRSADLWGPAFGARLLADAHRSAWPQASRDRLTLARARLRLEAGEAQLGEGDAVAVADGGGPEATEARLLLAGLRFSEAQDLDDLEPARAVLLPAVGDPRVLDLLQGIRMVEILGEGLNDDDPPETLFAAAELARDEIGATALSRNLLLKYAQTGAPWRGKALLAAAQLADDPAEREPILRELDQIRDDPYVRMSRAGGDPPSRVSELEVLLEETMARLLSVATSRARGFDVMARERSDTVQ